MKDKQRSKVISNNSDHLKIIGDVASQRGGDLVASSAVQHGAMEGTVPPTDLDEVRKYRLNRLKTMMRTFGYPSLLLFDPINTRYATDFTNQSNRSMRVEHCCVFVPMDGEDNATILDIGHTPFLSTGVPTIQNGEYRTMEKYYYDYVPDNEKAWIKAQGFARQIRELQLKYVGSKENVIAVDYVSHLGAQAMKLFHFDLQDGQKITEHARSIKSTGELALQQVAIKSCEVGIGMMNNATDLMKGNDTMSENELWSILQAQNIADGGEWIETRLLASGQRTNPWFQECSGNVFRVGDMVSFDTDLVGPYGYCADMSRSWVCGNDKITNDQRTIYNAAVSQVEANINNLKLYKDYKTLSDKSWAYSNPGWYLNRYSCPYHGIGLCDEYPSIPWTGEDWNVYGYSGAVEVGMTLSVESYIGDMDTTKTPPVPGPDGVKLEEMVHVESLDQNGIKLLTSYGWDPYLYDPKWST